MQFFIYATYVAQICNFKYVCKLHANAILFGGITVMIGVFL